MGRTEELPYPPGGTREPTPWVSRHSMFGLRWLTGLALTVNFVIFWSVPIALQGMLWKFALRPWLLPAYDWLDKHPALRAFAANHVFSKEKYSDYFATMLVLLTTSSVAIGTVTYTQLRYGDLPAWLIAAYYFAWVGFGGRIMGAAYVFAHKEGHNQGLYKKWIRRTTGNFFENYLGVLYGNVPFNFTTSHIAIHHRLDGGPGDTFYQFDLDRSSPWDFMLYVHRTCLHCMGVSSLRYFAEHKMVSKHNLLLRGIIIYWLVVPAAILLATRSLKFLFYIYIEPFCCMAYFLAFLNFGYHGFVDFDEEGRTVPCVSATAIVDGEDDYFGEDDHMAHHYHTNVYFADLPDHQKTQVELWKRHHASVFHKISVVELSLFILTKQWDTLAEYYVDFTGELSKADVAKMLALRARQKEMSFADYQDFLRGKRRSAASAAAVKAKSQ